MLMPSSDAALRLPPSTLAVSVANNRDVVRLLRSAGGERNAGPRRYPVIIILKFQT